MGFEETDHNTLLVMHIKKDSSNFINTHQKTQRNEVKQTQLVPSSVLLKLVKLESSVSASAFISVTEVKL